MGLYCSLSSLLGRRIEETVCLKPIETFDVVFRLLTPYRRLRLLHSRNPSSKRQIQPWVGFP